MAREFDVVIIGAGPGAIRQRLKQRNLGLKVVGDRGKEDWRHMRKQRDAFQPRRCFTPLICFI